jgi:hypothetical protein
MAFLECARISSPFFPESILRLSIYPARFLTPLSAGGDTGNIGDLLVCSLEQLLWRLGCSNMKMPSKYENPEMWINPKSNMGRDAHSSSYGEGQNTHNSRFLELADVVLSLNKPANKKANPAAASHHSQK